MPLLSFERANQWVPLDFMLKTDKMKLPLHEFSFVKTTAPFFYVFAKDTQKSAMYDRTLYEGKSWFKIVKGNTFG